jgi:tryptophan synthase alpha chain
MDRIADTFARAKTERRKTLVGFLTAGDPDEAASLDHIRNALRNGVDLLELGVPFSDPTADGPTIQAAGQRALAAGMTLKKALDLTAVVRREFPDRPIVLFGYANPFLAYGYDALARDAAAAGADALLAVDIPFEESAEIRRSLDTHRLALIPLVAPTTSLDRARALLRDARGFVYYIMVRGVTGARASLAPDAAGQLAALRQCTRLPIAAGFGISNGAQARECARYADGVVVGSALVAAAQAGRLVELSRELSAALRA